LRPAASAAVVGPDAVVSAGEFFRCRRARAADPHHPADGYQPGGIAQVQQEHGVRALRHAVRPGPTRQGFGPDRSDPGRAPISAAQGSRRRQRDRKSTRLNSSHEWISYAVFCLKKKITMLITCVYNREYHV